MPKIKLRFVKTTKDGGTVIAETAISDGANYTRAVADLKIIVEDAIDGVKSPEEVIKARRIILNSESHLAGEVREAKETIKRYIDAIP